MNSERWQILERIFFGALDASVEEREHYLTQQCGEDTGLRAEIEALLKSAGDDPMLKIEKHLEVAASPQTVAPSTGQTIGRYQLKELLGRGGMGEVYRAERSDGEFRQEVAIKLVSGLVPGPETIRRFKAERQILARLNHTNIARLIDGGATDEGRPFLVMQLVMGRPITEYCDRNDLDSPTKLKLFQTVCAAVQYAHQNLVIHRDLKPSNILVTDEGEVRLLDFGIAKLLEPDEEFTLPRTLTGSLLMTPETAAPEQVRGEPVTTSTDVYGLGVLMYRLLVGQNPYGLQQPTRRDVEQAILEQEPVRPSNATSDATQQKALRGELDNIILTALRKEPERRYGSARELSDDVQRYLDDEPVKASRDTVAYRATKFVRRHRWGVAAAAAIATLIVGFGAVTAVQARAIAAERDTAQGERDRAEQVVQVLVDLFRTTDPTVDAAADTMPVGVFLEQSQQKIIDDLAEQPDMQVRMKHVLGQVYLGRNQIRNAADILQDALDQKRRLTPVPDPVEAAIALNLADARSIMEGPNAEPFLREVVQLQRDVHGEQHPNVATAVTTLAQIVEAPEQRLELLEQALDVRRATLPEIHSGIANSLDAIGTHYYVISDFKAAATYFGQALEMLEQLLPPENPEVLTIANNVAQAHLFSGEHERALEMNETVLRRRIEVLGDSAQAVASSHNNAATIYAFMHDYPHAETSFRKALAIFGAAVGPEQGQTAGNVGLYANGARNIAITVQFQGRYEEALQWMDTAITVQASFAGIDGEGAARMRVHRANILLDMGRAQAAADSVTLVLPLLAQVSANGQSSYVAEAQTWLGRAYWMLGDGEQAESHFQDALQFRETLMGAESGFAAESRAGLGLALIQQGHVVEGTELIRSSLDAYREFGLMVPAFMEQIEQTIGSVPAGR